MYLLLIWRYFSFLPVTKQPYFRVINGLGCDKFQNVEILLFFLWNIILQSKNIYLWTNIWFCFFCVDMRINLLRALFITLSLGFSTIQYSFSQISNLVYPSTACEGEVIEIKFNAAPGNYSALLVSTDTLIALDYHTIGWQCYHTHGCCRREL